MARLESSVNRLAYLPGRLLASFKTVRIVVAFRRMPECLFVCLSYYNGMTTPPSLGMAA
jgi:hypothetical protein